MQKNNRISNALLQAEARIFVPVYINNHRNIIALPSINADLNLTLLNGFDDGNRFISNVTKKDLNESMPSTFIINNSDIIKNNNLNAGININLFDWELKNLLSEFSLALGGR